MNTIILLILIIIEYYIIPEEDRRQSACEGFFENSGFDEDNARLALEHAYYNLSIKDDMNNVLKDYYLYMMIIFSQIVGKSKAKGPLKYCESLNLSFESSLTSGQRKSVASAQCFHGQHQQGLDQNWDFHSSSRSAYAAGYSGAAKDDLYYDPSKTGLNIETSNTFADDQITIVYPTFYVNPTDYSDAQGSEQNWELYPPSESTSAGDHKPNIKNQFSSANYNPDLFFNDYEASFSPSLFISSPDENSLNDPNYKPSS